MPHERRYSSNASSDSKRYVGTDTWDTGASSSSKEDKGTNTDDEKAKQWKWKQVNQ
jgi:hypothetical protein